MIGTWGPVAFWMAVVATVSLVPARGPEVDLVFGADKWAHAALYAVLGWLGVRGARRSGAPPIAAWTIALAIGGLYGAGLELLQGRVGRDPSVADGLADLLGTALGAGVLTIRTRTERLEEA